MRHVDCQCKRCHVDVERVLVDGDGYPPCPVCKREMEWLAPQDGHAVHTDVFGRERFFNGPDETATSQREMDQKMKARGYEPCGDKEHGARNESHLNLGKAYSFSGQGLRRSTAERHG